MARWRLPTAVFLLVVLTGTGVLMLKQSVRKAAPVPPQPRRTEPVRKVLPPLKLPDEKRNSAGENGWEFDGEIAANFVSARGKLVSFLMHQGWRPDKQISLDESSSPRVLLTFQKESMELVLMLWKISISSTGFSYKREKIITPGVEVL